MAFFTSAQDFFVSNSMSLEPFVSCAKAPGGDSHMEGTGMLVGNFKFNP